MSASEDEIPKISFSASTIENAECEQEISIGTIPSDLESVRSTDDNIIKSDSISNEDTIKRMPLNVSKLIDTDSDESITKNVNTNNNFDSESDSENFQPTHKSKVNAICDSDSSDENKTQKAARQINSDVSDNNKFNDYSTDSSNHKEDGIEIKRKKLLKKKRGKNKSQIFESDDSENDTRKELKTKLNALCDTESSDDDINETIDKSISPKTDIRALKKPNRMSAKDASEQRKLIQSESQRMEREAQISIPYHRPKQFTLKEFLNRKSLSKPNSVTYTGKKAAAALKMSKDELISFAKQLKEREIESQEFFKSESEDENIVKNDVLENLIDINNKDENLLIVDKESEKSKIVEETNVIGDSNLIVENKIDNGSSGIAEKVNEIYSSEEIQIINKESAAIDTESLNDIIPLHVENEKILDKNKKHLNDYPTKIPFIKGAPNTIIDFESGAILRNQSGVDQLLEKFIINTKTNRLIDNDKITEVILDGNNKESIKEPKPGAALVKLKKELSQKIAENRKTRLLQKIEEHKKNTEESEEEEMEEEFDSDNETNTKAEKEIIKDIKINDDEEIIDDNDYKEPKEDEVDDEDNEEKEILENNSSDESENTNSDDENDSKYGDNLKTDVSIKKSRIISAFVDSDEEEHSSGTKNTASEKVDIDIPNKFSILTQNENDDLLELCSGRFEETQSVSEEVASPLDSHLNFVKSSLFQESQPVNEGDLMELCSGTFTTQKPDIEPSNIFSSEDPSNLEENDNIVNFNELVCSSDEDDTKVKDNTINKSKKQKQLQYSDDEDNDENSKQGVIISNEESENESIFEEEKLHEEQAENLEYDSEENEVDLKTKKSNNFMKANDYLDIEAELSESEWGSADESETEIDKYDIELADGEKFNKQKMREELERIHMRRVLDDDDRELKILKNMFFEDEEDNAARERQFRWKNVDNTLTLDEQKGDENVTGTQEGSDDETEEHWRRMRHERELLLKTDENIITTEVTKIRNEENNIPTEVTSIKKKIEVIKFNTSLDQTNNTISPFIIKKSKKTEKKTTRGSFLLRDNETLSRLASLTKSSDTTDSIEKSGNFVFSVLSPSVESDKKIAKRTRNDDDVENNQKKKQKVIVEPEKKNSKKRLLDYLM